MDNLDIESFIDEMRKRPALWDPAVDEYKDKYLKKRMWVEVCCAVVPNFSQNDDRTNVDIAKFLQKKWRHIRDAYVRSLRFQKPKKNGEGIVKRSKPYVYAKKLKFLQNSLTTIAASAYSDSYDHQYESQDAGNGDNIEDSLEKSKTEPISSEQSSCEIKKKSLEYNLWKPFELSSVAPSTQPQKKRIPETLDDDDLEFFRSLRPTLGSMTQNQKLKFRVDVLNALLGYRISHQPSSNSSLQHEYPQPSHIPHPENAQPSSCSFKLSPEHSPQETVNMCMEVKPVMLQHHEQFMRRNKNHLEYSEDLKSSVPNLDDSEMSDSCSSIMSVM